MELELLSQQPDQPTDKPPLLFLHGMGFGAWCWQEHFLPWFANQGYASHAMSLRGHGQSPLKQGESLRRVKLECYIEDLAQIYHSFDQTPILIGHSMGGFIVQKFLAEHDFRKAGSNASPKAVILLSSVPSNGIFGVALKTLRHFPLPALKALLKLSARPLLDSPEIFKKTLLSSNFSVADLKRYSTLTGEESFRAFSTLLLASSPKRRKNPPPMLVLAAQNDAYIPVKSLQDTASYYKADFKILPNLAHLAMLDTNWESSADAILNWLKEQDL